MKQLMPLTAVLVQNCSLILLCMVYYIIIFVYFLRVIRPNVSSALFFKYNTALGPPYRVLVDTNFINFSIQNKVIFLFPLCLL